MVGLLLIAAGCSESPTQTQEPNSVSLAQFAPVTCADFTPQDQCGGHDKRGCRIDKQQCVAAQLPPGHPCQQSSREQCRQQDPKQCDWNDVIETCYEIVTGPAMQQQQQQALVAARTATVCVLKPQFRVDCASRAASGEAACNKDDHCKWTAGEAASCKQIDNLCQRLYDGHAQEVASPVTWVPVTNPPFCSEGKIKVSNNTRQFTANPKLAVGGGPVLFSTAAQPAVCHYTPASGADPARCDSRFQEDLCELYFQTNKNYAPAGGWGGGGPPSQQDVCEKGIGSEMLLFRDAAPTLNVNVDLGSGARNYHVFPHIGTGGEICQFTAATSPECVNDVTTNPCMAITGTPQQIEKDCGKTAKTKDLCEVKVIEANNQ